MCSCREWSNFDEDLHALGAHFKDYTQLQRIELLPYHTLGVHKYEALGWEYKLKDVPVNTPEQKQHAEEILRHYFNDKLVVN